MSSLVIKWLLGFPHIAENGGRKNCRVTGNSQDALDLFSSDKADDVAQCVNEWITFLDVALTDINGLTILKTGVYAEMRMTQGPDEDSGNHSPCNYLEEARGICCS